jgi:hypothetical protein
VDSEIQIKLFLLYRLYGLWSWVHLVTVQLFYPNQRWCDLVGIQKCRVSYWDAVFHPCVHSALLHQTNPSVWTDSLHQNNQEIGEDLWFPSILQVKQCIILRFSIFKIIVPLSLSSVGWLTFKAVAFWQWEVSLVSEHVCVKHLPNFQEKPRKNKQERIGKDSTLENKFKSSCTICNCSNHRESRKKIRRTTSSEVNSRRCCCTRCC